MDIFTNLLKDSLRIEICCIEKPERLADPSYISDVKKQIRTMAKTEVERAIKEIAGFQPKPMSHVSSGLFIEGIYKVLARYPNAALTFNMMRHDIALLSFDNTGRSRNLMGLYDLSDYETDEVRDHTPFTKENCGKYVIWDPELKSIPFDTMGEAMTYMENFGKTFVQPEEWNYDDTSNLIPTEVGIVDLTGTKLDDDVGEYKSSMIGLTDEEIDEVVREFTQERLINLPPVQ